MKFLDYTKNKNSIVILTLDKRRSDNSFDGIELPEEGYKDLRAVLTSKNHKPSKAEKLLPVRRIESLAYLCLGKKDGRQEPVPKNKDYFGLLFNQKQSFTEGMRDRFKSLRDNGLLSFLDNKFNKVKNRGKYIRALENIKFDVEILQEYKKDDDVIAEILGVNQGIFLEGSRLDTEDWGVFKSRIQNKVCEIVFSYRLRTVKKFFAKDDLEVASSRARETFHYVEHWGATNDDELNQLYGMLFFANDRFSTMSSDSEAAKINQEIPQWLNKLQEDYPEHVLDKEERKEAYQDFEKDVATYRAKDRVEKPLGRRDLILQIKGSLEDYPETPVLLQGAGRVGKTHIAVELEYFYGKRTQWIFDRVFFITLSSFDKYFLVRVLKNLGLSYSREDNPLKKLWSHVSKEWKGQKHLIIFDDLQNLEKEENRDKQTTILQQFYDIARYLAGVSGTTVLVTSRNEHPKLKAKTFKIETFSPPRKDLAGEPDSVQYDEATGFALDLISGSHSNFELNPQNYASVANICQWASYIPLIIHPPFLFVNDKQPLDKIAEQLKIAVENAKERFKGYPASVRGILEGSFALLSKKEQQVWCRLSTLEGGFTADLAKEVAPNFLEVRDHLLNHAFLQQNIQRGGYVLQDLHKSFAREKLTEVFPNQEAEAHQKHALYFAAVAREKILTLFLSNNQKVLETVGSTVKYFETEIVNCRRAWDWFMNKNHWDAQFKSHEYASEKDYRNEASSTSLAPLAIVFSFYNQLLELTENAQIWLVRQLEILENRECSPLLKATLYESKAFCHYRLGELNSAYKAARKAVKLSRKVPQSLELGHSLTVLAIICISKGNYQEGMNSAKEGWEICETIGSLLEKGLANQALVMAKVYSGETIEEFEETIKDGRGLLQFYDQIGNGYSYKIASYYLSDAYLCQHLLTRNGTSLNEAIKVLDEAEKKWSAAKMNYLINLTHPTEQRARINFYKGELESATIELDDIEDHYRITNNEILLIRLYILRAQIASKKGEDRTVKTYLLQSFDIALEERRTLVETFLVPLLLESARFFLSNKEEDFGMELLTFVAESKATPAYTRIEAKNLYQTYKGIKDLQEAPKEADHLMTLATRALSLLKK